MPHLSKKDLSLSPARRALLERLIQKQGFVSPGVQAIPRRDDPSRAWLSFAQQRLWFINELEPGNAAYNDHFAVRLTGAINPAALEQGINEILRRQELLRTTFGVVNGQPLQFITPVLKLPVA